MKLTEVQQTVFNDRFALRDPNTGEQLETTPEQMWRRVAKEIASVEDTLENKAKWEREFYDMMEDFKYVPGGRILFSSGLNRGATAMNCYVIPAPKDSRDGIIRDSLWEWTEIQSKGGGVGINMSSLRPRGALVKKVNGYSSGPVSWADPFSHITEKVIQQGGTRRGAAMIMLDISHPDIQEFIHAKETPGEFGGCNMSVCISNSFMYSVKNDLDWTLRWQSRETGEVIVGKTLKARDLWNEICEAAWKSGEPGVFFMERANDMANSKYFETIETSNPCVVGETQILTRSGWEQIESLEGQVVEVWNGEAWSNVHVRQTGSNQPIVRVTLTNGHYVDCTPNHRFYLSDGSYCTAGQLSAGMKLERLANIPISGNYKVQPYSSAYAQGFFAGDGSISHEEGRADRSWIFFYGKEKQAIGYKLNELGHVSISSFDANQDRLIGRYLGEGSKTAVPVKADPHTQLEWLAGLLDSDGNIAYNGKDKKAFAYQISSTNREFLRETSLLVRALGASSSIDLMKPAEVSKRMPGGFYDTKNCYRLTIPSSAAYTLGVLGLPVNRVPLMLVKPQRNAQRYPVVESITERGIADKVYCFTEPSRGRGVFNGILTGQCGEQPLGPYGACLLGAVNVSKFVIKHAGWGEIDTDALAEVVKTAVRFNDNVIDYSSYPLKECEESQKRIRRMGIGILGLADALIMLGIRYGSEDSLLITEEIYRTIRDAAYAASVELAKERGAFPAYTAEYLNSEFVKTLPTYIRKSISEHGIRNCYLLTQAPTGSTSLLAGANSGIEPYFAFGYRRNDRLGEYMVYAADPEWYKLYNSDNRPDYLITANDIPPIEHIDVQAAAQRFVDASISKTVNAPANTTLEEVKELYMRAFDKGLKSVTVYVDGSRTEQVLYREVEEEEKTPIVESHVNVGRKKLPDLREALTHKFVVGGQEGYVTVGFYPDTKKIGEMFITISKAGSTLSGVFEWGAVNFSMALQHGASIEELTSKMISTRFEPAGFTSNREIPMATSILDYLGKWLMSLGMTVDDNTTFTVSTISGDLCGTCGSITAYEEGCMKCYVCGDSKCN